MSSTPKAALSRAREHAAEIRSRAARALDGDLHADSTAVRRHLRALLRSCDNLDRAHDDCERALEEPGTAAHDPVTNPSAATGAQTSSGQQPRSLDPETRRLQDQLRSCQIAYRERLRQMGML